MKEKSSIFMTYGMVLGMIIGVIITVFILIFANEYSYLFPVILLAFGILFRIIGYGLDRMMDARSK